MLLTMLLTLTFAPAETGGVHRWVALSIGSDVGRWAARLSAQGFFRHEDHDRHVDKAGTFASPLAHCVPK